MMRHSHPNKRGRFASQVVMLTRNTYRKRTLARVTLPILRHCRVIPTYTTSQLLKHPLLPCLPVPSRAVLQDTIKVLLGVSARFFNCGDDVLLVRMAEVACDIGVLERP